MLISDRISARIAHDFPEPVAGQVVDLLASVELPDEDGPGSDRVTGSILILADGDIDELVLAAALAVEDWRDLFVAAGLEQLDWAQRLYPALENAPRGGLQASIGLPRPEPVGAARRRAAEQFVSATRLAKGGLPEWATARLAELLAEYPDILDRPTDP